MRFAPEDRDDPRCKNPISFATNPVSLRWPFPKMGGKGPHRRRSLGRPTFGPNLRKARQVMNNTNVEKFVDILRQLRRTPGGLPSAAHDLHEQSISHNIIIIAQILSYKQNIHDTHISI